MVKTISFLLGSGFSIPEGLPSVKELNDRLGRLQADDIMIWSDMTAYFREGPDDINSMYGHEEKLFVQEFLRFYREQVLNPDKEFNYEIFYDYYSGYLNNKECKEQIEGFCDEFNKTFGHARFVDCHNRISDFDRTYNQLIAELLHKPQYFEDVSTANYPPYDEFIGFLALLLKDGWKVKVHTLNHDLFFDWLASGHSDLWQHFSDGFERVGSPFYGKLCHTFNLNSKRPSVSKTYFVKMERFTDTFETQLCFHKLHGSIFNIVAHLGNGQTIRIKNNYGIQQYFIEGQNSFDLLHSEVTPDFISGTTNKLRLYSADPHYKRMLDHFTGNLDRSSLLIAIGYGFGDPGINDLIHTHYLSRGRHLIVVDPCKSYSESILTAPNTIHIGQRIESVSFEEWTSLLKYSE